uniref:Uncharacterized protein n=1 Tax=Parastrongyloides trichosuri TaxID=131310 RepID=A0A0N4ZEL6_PARTI
MLKIIVLTIFIPNVLSQIIGSIEPHLVNADMKTQQFPQLITADNFPLFPFTDQFNWGIEINPANKVALGSDLNIPVPGWGNWDLDANLYTGNINTDTRVGVQVRPTNKLGIKPETLVLLGQNPAFRAARKKAKEVLVGKMPYNYMPSKCKPPYCNPFVHFVTAGVEVEEGDDTFFIGGIDFPLPVGPRGEGVRFPLSGAFEQGTSPFAYVHAHAYNPSTPFDFTKIDNVRKSPRKKGLNENETSKEVDENEKDKYHASSIKLRRKRQVNRMVRYLPKYYYIYYY